ncbi:hypothetical protein EYF80_055734 [Liparis tanakae]|uniref:Uncharacterized protein n=1 Tax=Liparis tanakae TaxID=230148 RepID=A0A4Z2F0C9_9TELE|nr:hypothetical protein EYF80_055734 [Liparis tanakae]
MTFCVVHLSDAVKEGEAQEGFWSHSGSAPPSSAVRSAPRSAGRLHVVVVEARVERRGQRAADDYNPRRQAVVAAMQNVPDEHGRRQRGQQAGGYVQVAGVGQVCVGPDAVERHQPNHQHET